MSDARGAGDVRPGFDWFVVSRLAEFSGELRANLLRILGIVVFYGLELVHYYELPLGFTWLERPPYMTVAFQQAVTAAAVAWLAVAIGVQICLQSRFLSPALKFTSSSLDVLLLTLVLALAEGPRSPLVAGYFVLIVMAALRTSLPLVWCVTLASMAGYLGLCGYARWYAPNGAEIAVSRYAQVVTLAALGLAGLVVGQVVRNVRRTAETYAARLAGGETP